MAGENYYEILGLGLEASAVEIDAAYRLQKSVHEKDPARLRLIQEAFDTLINPMRRKAYRAQLASVQAAAPQPAAPQPADETRSYSPPVMTATPPASGGKPARQKTQFFDSNPQGTPAQVGQPAAQPASQTPTAGQAPVAQTPAPAQSAPASSTSKGGRQKTQIFDSDALGAPAPVGQPAAQLESHGPAQAPAAQAPVAVQPAPANPPSKGGRQKTQIFDSNPQGVPAQVEQPPAQAPAVAPPPMVAQPSAAGLGQGGRQKTQIVDSNLQGAAAPAAAQPAAPAGPTPGGGRPSTADMGAPVKQPARTDRLDNPAAPAVSAPAAPAGPTPSKGRSPTADMGAPVKQAPPTQPEPAYSAPSAPPAADGRRKGTEVFEMPANQAPPTDPATPAAATERQPRGTEAMMAPPVKAPTAPTQIVIEVTYGAKTSTYTLLPGDNVVGRQSLKGGPPPTILLEDADQRYVSRKHIHIQVQDERWVVIDTSTNGTEYNGARMVPSKSYPLKVGDKIVIEDRQLLVKSIS